MAMKTSYLFVIYVIYDVCHHFTLHPSTSERHNDTLTQDLCPATNTALFQCTNYGATQAQITAAFLGTERKKKKKKRRAKRPKPTKPPALTKL